MKRKSWVQPAEAARYFGVNSSTIRQWISDGTLRAARLPTGHLRILARDVVKQLLEKGRSIPAELGSLASKHVLIVDPHKDEARAMAAALRGVSGCKVTVADTAMDARGLLNGARPDLVVLGVRGGKAAAAGAGNGNLDMLILAAATEEPVPDNDHRPEAAFRVNDILSTPVDQGVVVSRVATALLG